MVPHDTSGPHPPPAPAARADRVLAVGLGLTLTANAGEPPPGPSVPQFLHDYFAAMDTALMPGAQAAGRLTPFYATGGAATPQTAALVRRELGKVDAFHRWVSDKHDVYRSITTTSTVDSTSPAPSGQQVTVEVTATTTMRWSPPAAPAGTRFTAEKAKTMAEETQAGRVFGPGDTVTSVVSTQHDMRLVQQHGTWTIQSDRYRDPFDQGDTDDSAIPAADPAGAGPSVLPATVEPYNRQAAVAYADRWALSYNPRYVNYSKQGGDCANFVSQALGDSSAAALAFEPTWYYTYPSGPGKGRGRVGGSVDWINANHLHGFVTANPAGPSYSFGSLGAYGSWSQTNAFDLTSMQPGDLHFYDWNNDGVADHSSIAVALLVDGTTLVDAHSAGKYHVRYDFGTSYDNATRYYMDQMNDTISVP